MARPDPDALDFERGEVTTLPHTLSQTRQLTLTLVGSDEAGGTATFELHNPGASPDIMVSGLIGENERDVAAVNRRRDAFHLPEKPVPVDTSTAPVEVLHVKLREKLQVGDRVWAVTSIAADRVTLTPGRDHETRSVLNEVEDTAYGPVATALEQDLNVVDRGL